MAMADDVWVWCEKHQVFGQTVTVKIKYADFRHVTLSKLDAGSAPEQLELGFVSTWRLRGLEPSGRTHGLPTKEKPRFRGAKSAAVVAQLGVLVDCQRAVLITAVRPCPILATRRVTLLHRSASLSSGGAATVHEVRDRAALGTI